MKEKIIDLFHESKQQIRDKKQQINKKRAIRKQKTQSSTLDLYSIDTSKLSRQEKAQLQKVKNRQSAQKSRDQHRQYVFNLQRQIQQLKNNTRNVKRYCDKCLKQLGQDMKNDKMQNQNIQQQKNQKQCLQISKTEQTSFQLFEGYRYQYLNNIQEKSNQQIYLRQEEQQWSYNIGYYVILIFMIIAVFISFTNKNNVNRILVDSNIQQVNKNQKQQKEKDQINNTTQVNKNETAVVKLQQKVKKQIIEQKYNNGLILKDDDCWRSLIQHRRQSQQDKRSLTAIYQNSDLIPSSALYCQVRVQPSIRIKPRRIGPYLNLFMIGRELKQLISSSNIAHTGHIRLNGIYQIIAKIKQVSLVPNHRCLLL